ncbi:patatin-like phospholipase family protein [Helicobacter himalayensis]|uniref:patatin-like phospholipase family protein n=1 Tax=Helicobacter himalayensis TaxID=1591088 RepID=UPI00083698AD|nr:patatin-like phospholipase family protein [Helicobacter himalayensis]
MAKKALVLGGGGSKGAYQVGAYKALVELEQSFDLVVGTSIGALNGALIVQNDFALLCELWEKISVEKVISHGLNFTQDMDYYFANTQKILPFLKSYAQNKGMDTSPLQGILNHYLNWERIESSKLDFGLVTLEIPSLTPYEVRKNMMDKDTLSLWVLASASCFPAFPIFEFGGKSFIDGGYYDNVPIGLAYKMGAQEVVAVSLNWDFESKYDTNPLVTHIRPSMYLGSMLDFSKNAIEQNITLGYLETMRAFGKFVGQCYCFAPQSIDENLEAKIHTLLRQILSQELNKSYEATTFSAKFGVQMANTGLFSKVASQTPFCDKLLQLANFHKEPKVRWHEILFFLVESYMSLCNFERTKVWDMREVLAMARKHFESGAFSEILESARDADSSAETKETKSAFDTMLYIMRGMASGVRFEHFKKQLLEYKPNAELLEPKSVKISACVLLEIVLNL